MTGSQPESSHHGADLEITGDVRRTRDRCVGRGATSDQAGRHAVVERGATHTRSERTELCDLRRTRRTRSVAMSYRPPTPEGPQAQGSAWGFRGSSAFAAQRAGWYLRSDIIWNKPNCMPESREGQADPGRTSTSSCSASRRSTSTTLRAIGVRSARRPPHRLGHPHRTFPWSAFRGVPERTGRAVLASDDPDG